MTGHQPTVQLNPDQMDFFRENGYLTLPAIISPQEIAWMRGILHRLFETRAGWKRGVHFDLAGLDDDERPAALPQILSPATLAPELARSQFRINAFAIARQLLGPKADLTFDHAILKPKEGGAPTPWHQDEAHNGDSECKYEQVSIWMPLQDVTLANGCLRFIPGTHRGPVLPHRSLNDDPRIQALECIGNFNANDAVSSPAPAGGAVIHHCRTLHSAGPNKSTEPRLAYVLAFCIPPPAAKAPKPYPWNAIKHTAAQARAQAWRNRGGILGRLARAIVRGLRDWAKRALGR